MARRKSSDVCKENQIDLVSRGLRQRSTHQQSYDFKQSEVGVHFYSGTLIGPFSSIKFYCYGKG